MSVSGFADDRPANPVARHFKQAAKNSPYLTLLSAGAYGFVMASSYNMRSLAAEVLVSGRKSAVVRARQPVEEIWAGEKVVPWLK